MADLQSSILLLWAPIAISLASSHPPCCCCCCCCLALAEPAVLCALAGSCDPTGAFFCSVSEKQNLILVPGRPFESPFLRSFSGFCGFPHFIDVYFSPHRPHFCVQECLWSVVILLAPSRCKHTRGHHAVPRARGRGRYPNTPANDDGNTSVMHFAA